MNRENKLSDKSNVVKEVENSRNNLDDHEKNKKEILLFQNILDGMEFHVLNMRVQLNSCIVKFDAISREIQALEKDLN